jgi:hypothetical protein
MSDIRPQIDDPQGLQDAKATSILRVMKAIIDSITGRRQGQHVIKELDPTANINGIIQKINEVIRRLQSIPDPPPTPKGAMPTRIEDLVVERNIRLDISEPSYGWRDITGDIVIRAVGAANPAFSDYNSTGVFEYLFSNLGVNEIFVNYHIPHDYVPGTDLFIHTHWSQTTVDTGGAAGVPGVAKWSFTALYAKGFAQQAFPNAATTVFATQQASPTIREHMIAEVQLTTAGALGGNAIEVDGIVIVRIWRDPADGADTLNVNPFLHFVDIHYQSSNMATKRRAPDFYV